MRGRLFASFAALLAVATPAHAIPPPPPPPDPAVMAEANGLADELIALDEQELRYRTGFAVSSEATGWLLREHPDVRDPVVLGAFHRAIRAKVDAVWLEERPNVQAVLANLYRLITARDLVAARSFFASSSGQNFGRLLVGADIHLLDTSAAAVLYRRLGPELPAMLEVAQKQMAE